jgi:hypothetical protein
MAFPQMPYRMNPASFHIKPYSSGEFTPKDRFYREPKGTRLFGPDIIISGQLVGYRGFFNIQRNQTGLGENSRGSAVFRPSVLAKSGWEPKDGDRIVQINNTPCDFIVVHVTPLSPYRNNNLLMYIEWEQNRSVKESI